MSNVLVYAGPGTSQSALTHTINSLRALLPSYDVQSIQAKSIALDPWPSTTSLFVLPGGRDLPYVEAFSQRYTLPSGKPSATAAERINDFVRKDGGAFLGICAGAYYASAFCDFEEGTKLEVRGERPALRFFPGTCKGTVYPGFVYESDAGSRVVQLSLSEALGGKTFATHYNGGGAFMDAARFAGDGVEVLAAYSRDDPALAPGAADASTSAYAEQAAAVIAPAGKGKALLFGVHPEFPLSARSAPIRKIGSPSTLPETAEAMQEQEERRLRIFGRTLALLGLEVRVPQDARDDAVSRGVASLALASTGGAKEPSITQPPRLTPLVLMETEEHAVQSVLDSLRPLARPPASDLAYLRPKSSANAAAADGPVEQIRAFSFKDVNDAFHIFEPSTAGPDQENAEMAVKTRCLEADYAPYIAPPANAEDGANDQEAEDETAVDLNAVPKTIIAYASGARPVSTARLTPYFDPEAFAQSLAEARRRLREAPIARSSGISWHAPVRLASAYMYSQVVTSTQTMLDKNYKVLTRLPIGFTAIATHQVSGRGRGGNNWISPLGCLQFSTVLQLPKSLATGVVFVQYLAGLAIVLGIRKGLGEAYEPIGHKVRIKWPNDVYAEVGEDLPGEEQRKGTFTVAGKRYAKLAGVLVNSQFAGNDFALVVGCGINCLNSRPTTSLSDLIRMHNATLPRGQKEVPVVSQDALLGAILATFEHLWNVFTQTGTFESFRDLYKDIWLHSNQETLLVDTEPPTKARIVGISSDYGMLRAVPTDSETTTSSPDAWGKSANSRAPFIDLQPDGNSFDMLHNLIRRKE